MTAMDAKPTLSMKGDRWIRRTAFLMIATVAIASAVLSWSGLTYLAIQADIPANIAFLLPLAIDGSLVLGAALVIHGSLAGYGTGFGWLMTAFGVTLSIWGNIAAVSAHDLQAQVVHAIAPICLFLSIEGLIRIIRHRITVSMEAQAEAERLAAREARKRERDIERETLTTARKEKDTRVLLATPKRGGGKVHETDAEVASYREVIGNMPAGTPKVKVAEEVLRQYPEARTGHIGIAMGMDARQVGTTVHRAKAKLLKGSSAPEVSSKADEDAESVQGEVQPESTTDKQFAGIVGSM